MKDNNTHPNRKQDQLLPAPTSQRQSTIRRRLHRRALVIDDGEVEVRITVERTVEETVIIEDHEADPPV